MGTEDFENQLVVALKQLHRTGSISIWRMYKVSSVCFDFYLLSVQFVLKGPTQVLGRR
jgi:hypothetical protein